MQRAKPAGSVFVVVFCILVLGTTGPAGGAARSSAFFLAPPRAAHPGPSYSMLDLGDAGANAIDDRGWIVGIGANHAVLWQDGVLLDLGTLPGDTHSNAFAVNESGQIVGSSFHFAPFLMQAFLWQDGRMTALGTLGGNFSIARGINARGQVVGASRTASGESHAFLWQDGVMTDLGTLGGNSSQALAINEREQVVGSSKTAQGEEHAFLWQGGAMTDLGTLGGGSSSASDIDERGQVVGGSKTAGGESHAFLWTNGAMTDLGALGDRTETYASGINERGQVVGIGYYAMVPGTAQFPHAFLCEDGVMTDLGTFEGRTESDAAGINDRGQVVGWSRNYSGNQRALLWQPGVPIGRDTELRKPAR